MPDQTAASQTPLDSRPLPTAEVLPQNEPRKHEAAQPKSPSPLLADEAFQREILPGVSRTFALTIRQLPAGLRQTVTIAYLLCRIADTIEDEASLTPQQVEQQQQRFLDAVRGELDPGEFARDAAALLTSSTLAAERELVANTPRVLSSYQELPKAVKTAMWRCIQRMSSGMA